MQSVLCIVLSVFVLEAPIKPLLCALHTPGRPLILATRPRQLALQIAGLWCILSLSFLTHPSPHPSAHNMPSVLAHGRSQTFGLSSHLVCDSIRGCAHHPGESALGLSIILVPAQLCGRALRVGDQGSRGPLQRSMAEWVLPGLGGSPASGPPP